LTVYYFLQLVYCFSSGVNREELVLEFYLELRPQYDEKGSYILFFFSE